MAKFVPENTYTLDQFILAGHRTTVSYDEFSYKEALSNGNIVTILNVIDDYIPEIMDSAVNVRLDRLQRIKYRYKPKLLCYDVYGNTELYWVILRMNGIIDVKEFDFEILKMLRVDDMELILTNIYNSEYKWMKKYNTEYGAT